jgi:uncharacterized LabA/DUF88 family protein
MNSRPQLAVLIDAENVSYKRESEIFERIAVLGEPAIRVAFGDWTPPRLDGWKDVASERAIRLEWQLSCNQHKNGSDIALAVEAMDLLHLSRPDGFVVVSGDSDFIPLVTRLRERLRSVYVIGSSNTSAMLRAACTEFYELKPERADTNVAAASSAPPKPAVAHKAVAKKVVAKSTAAPQPVLTVTPKVEERIRTAIKRTAGDQGWASISSMAKQLGPGTRPKNFGHATWAKFFAGREGFEVRNAKLPTAAVRSRT